jgi:mRNA interferase HigB
MENKSMRVISKKALDKFAQIYPDAKQPLTRWYGIIKKAAFQNFNEVRQVFPSADKVGNCTVFNIGGNKYRLITAIHYNRQIIYIRLVLTHAEYDLAYWTGECEK